MKRSYFIAALQHTQALSSWKLLSKRSSGKITYKTLSRQNFTVRTRAILLIRAILLTKLQLQQHQKHSRMRRCPRRKKRKWVIWFGSQQITKNTTINSTTLVAFFWKRKHISASSKRSPGRCGRHLNLASSNFLFFYYWPKAWRMQYKVFTASSRRDLYKVCSFIRNTAKLLECKQVGH